MGLFDRINGNTSNTRAAIEVNGANSGLGAIGRVDLTGLWAGASRGANADLNKFRPAADDASTASAVAARAVDLIVQSAASRPLLVTTDSGEPVDHYLETLFNVSPNASQSGLLFRQAVWHRLIHRGEAFIILDRGKSRVDQPKSAHVHFGTVKVVVSKPTAVAPHGEVLGYKVSVGDDIVVLAPTEVLWLRFADAGSPWASRAPMAAALDAIGLSRAARMWQAGQLANSGNPSGIVYVGQPASDEDYDYAREEIEAALTGPSSAGRIATVGGPVAPQFIRTSFNAAEVGYLDTLNAAGDEIALALGVPLDLIGGQRTFNNVETSWRIFWEGTIVPRLATVSSEINRQLLAGTGLSATFDTADVTALQEGRDAVASRTTAAAQNDIITIDEARAALGYDPLPNGAGNVMLSAFRAPFAQRPVAARSAIEEANTRTIAPEAAYEAPVASETHSSALQVRGITNDQANKNLDRLEASTIRAIQRLAEAQRKEATKRLDRNQRDITINADAKTVFNLASWIERAYDYVLPVIQASLDRGSELTADALGQNLNIDNILTEAADARAKTLAQLVNETTFQVLQDRLAAAAIADNITVAEFTKALHSTFDDLTGYRAETIARTEMVGGFNAGSRASAVASNGVVAREWVATGGNRTRESHAELDGYRTQSMDDSYPNGLMFPGDPSGDPSETINCRCVEVYVTDYSGGN